MNTDSAGTDVADGIDRLHVVHGPLHLLVLLLLLDRGLLSLGAQLALALGDVRREARLRGDLNTVGEVQG